MALIKCRECGKKISDKASICPHCGCVYRMDFQTKKSRSLSTNIIIIICGSCVIGIFLFVILFVLLRNTLRPQLQEGVWYVDEYDDPVYRFDDGDLYAWNYWYDEEEDIGWYTVDGTIISGYDLDDSDDFECEIISNVEIQCDGDSYFVES